MKKTAILFPLLLILLCSFIPITQSHSKKHLTYFNAQKEATVYICDSKSAYAYHSSSSCRGLNRCKSGIIKITLTDAISVYSRQPCKICY